MIEEQFVGYDTAELLKKAGFLEQTDTCYFGTTNRIGGATTITEDNGVLPRPTQAVAARWLREVHNLHVYAIQTNLPLTEPQTTKWEWGYVIDKVDNPNGESICDMNFTSYEEAMEAGIRHAIESVIVTQRLEKISRLNKAMDKLSWESKNLSNEAYLLGNDIDELIKRFSDGERATGEGS